MDFHTQFTHSSWDNQICLQQKLEQVQETLTYQVADCQISVRTVVDKLLFIQTQKCRQQKHHTC